MSVDPTSTGAEETMAAEIVAEDLSTPSAEKEVLEALDPLAGVENVRVDEEKVVVSYDPVQVTSQELAETLRETGHPPLEVKAERDSPLH